MEKSAQYALPRRFAAGSRHYELSSDCGGTVFVHEAT